MSAPDEATMPSVSKCNRTSTCPELIDHDNRCPKFDAEFWSKVQVRPRGEALQTPAFAAYSDPVPDEATGSRGEFVSCLPSLGEACGHCHRCTPPTPAPVSADERVVRVLEAHRLNKGLGQCRCGIECGGQGNREAVHRAHVAAALAPVLAEVRAEALRDAARYLRRQGSLRFDDHGPHDARGAALWDAGCAIDPNDGNKVGGTA